MLLLGAGHCFRDHVLEVCPEFARFASNAEGIRKSFEGSSLETIKTHGGRRHGRDAGAPPVGAARRPAHWRRAAAKATRPTSATCPSKKRRQPPPMRRVVLAWRRSFTRYEAIAALRNAIYACELPGVTRLS